MKKINVDLISTIIVVVRAVLFMLTVVTIIVGVELDIFEYQSWMTTIIVYQGVSSLVLALASYFVPSLNHES